MCHVVVLALHLYDGASDDRKPRTKFVERNAFRLNIGKMQLRMKKDLLVSSILTASEENRSLQSTSCRRCSRVSDDSRRVLIG